MSIEASELHGSCVTESLYLFYTVIMCGEVIKTPFMFSIDSHQIETFLTNTPTGTC